MNTGIHSDHVTKVDDRIEMSDKDKDLVIRSIVSSQEIEGVHVSYEDVALILDDVLREPMIEID